MVKKRSKKGFYIDPFFVAISLLLIPFTFYIGYRIYLSERRLIPISIIALLIGLIWENKRLAKKWVTIFSTIQISFLSSYLVFLPGKHEKNYNFETHILLWPYAFIVFFLIWAITFHGKKIVPKLTEGITLLHSIAIIYWVIDYGFINTSNTLLQILMGIGLLFSSYSIFHAFTKTALSRKSCLTLSIWSSIVMVLFAIDNIYRVYQNQHIENTTDINDGIYIGLQYFLLGVSSIYIAQNFLMLSGFIPQKERFFNDEYFKHIAKLSNEHTDRYSNGQVSTTYSFICLIFTGTFFGFNHYYQLLPRHIVIWIAFIIFPYFINLFEYLKIKTSKENTNKLPIEPSIHNQG